MLKGLSEGGKVERCREQRVPICPCNNWSRFGSRQNNEDNNEGCVSELESSGAQNENFKGQTVVEDM